MALKMLCQLIAILFCVGLCEAGEMVYFDADGKPISQEQYNQSKRERLEQKNKEKEKLLKKLSLIKDSQGRPVYDAQGRKIKYAAPIKTKHDKAAKPKIEYYVNAQCPNPNAK